MKQFIFGRSKDDPKGKPEEKGEVVIEAASLNEARDLFAKHIDPKGFYRVGDRGNGAHETNCRDARLYITRVDVGPVVVPKAKRRKK